jgi:hypothetical protein
MRYYTIYDNASGGFTLKWTFYDKFENKNVINTTTVDTKQEMINWKRKIESKGYKFVGKL